MFCNCPFILTFTSTHNRKPNKNQQNGMKHTTYNEILIIDIRWVILVSVKSQHLQCSSKENANCNRLYVHGSKKT
jgi:hypothetical protein